MRAFGDGLRLADERHQEQGQRKHAGHEQQRVVEGEHRCLADHQIVQLAQRYIEEGMRLDRHPGIFFRDGPSGRRAVVIGGPDVWEVVSAARSAPERGEALIAALSERVGVPKEGIRIAIRYYAEYPTEVDNFITMVEEESKKLEKALQRERQLTK